MLVHYSFALIQISFMSHSIAFSVRSGSFVAVHLPEPAIVHSTARFFWELPTSDVGAARFLARVAFRIVATWRMNQPLQSLVVPVKIKVV